VFDAQDLEPTANPGHSVPAAHGSSGQPVHLIDRLAAIFRHRRIAAGSFALVSGALMIRSYSEVPQYRAAAQVLIQDERSLAVGTLNANDPMFWQESDQYYNTQYSLLRSRGLARRVVSHLRLQEHPLFGAAARPQASLLSAGRGALVAWTSRVSSPATPLHAESRPDESPAEGALISQFLAGVDIVPEKSTRLVSIVYRSSSPEFAALAANAVADEYASQNLDLRLEAINKNLAWLEQEVKRQEARVTEAEAALTRYREEQNALSLENRQNIVVSRLNTLNETVTRARTARLQKETLHLQLKDVDPATDAADAFPVIATNPAVVEAKSHLNELIAQKTRLSTRYQSGHPEMALLDNQIARARELLTAQRTRVVESAKNDYAAAMEEERSFGAQLEAQKAAAMDLDRKSGGYLVLQREAETSRQVYQALLQQEKELRVVGNSRANNVQVMDRAEVPRAPFSPNRRRDWFTALLAGVLISLGLVFALEYLDDTVKTPDDVTARLNLPLLGLVPAVRESPPPLLSGVVPHEFGEAFRSLRTSLVFTTAPEGPRIVAVTSSQPLEGKTTTACNLATALAMGGARVLLIDADMRRPGLWKLMGVENAIGLSHLLVGQARVRDAIQRTAQPNLFVMASGHTPPNPSELLASDRMQRFIENLREGPFDWVIIDTPPVLAVTDAVIVGRLVSGVVFVVGSEMTRRVHAQRALEILMAGRPMTIGTVLNRVDFRRNKYYYARYYGYHYQSYYGPSSSAPV
jgi:capsular exopolysaccharide synthesis family protein